jgi:molybdate transport system substrate-binding protein
LPWRACSSAGALPLKSRIASSRAPPGIPVGSLVARGEVELGLQATSASCCRCQASRCWVHYPEPIQIVTTFSARRVRHQPSGGGGGRHAGYMASPAAAEAKRRHGMEPA